MTESGAVSEVAAVLCAHCGEQALPGELTIIWIG